MQLKIQRSQRPGGVLANKVIFCLDIRAQYSERESANISRYRLGGETVYSSRKQQQHFANMQAHTQRIGQGDAKESAAGLGRGLVSLALAKMSLEITVASLARGQHIECKDLSELSEAEEAVRGACRNLKNYLEVANSFNGSVILVDFDEGEKEHISQGVLTIEGSSTSVPSPGLLAGPTAQAASRNTLFNPATPPLDFSSLSAFLKSLETAAKANLELVIVGLPVLIIVLVMLVYFVAPLVSPAVSILVAILVVGALAYRKVRP